MKREKDGEENFFLLLSMSNQKKFCYMS